MLIPATKHATAARTRGLRSFMFLLRGAAVGAAFLCLAYLPAQAQGTSVTPTALDFANQLVGTTSAAQMLTVKNTGATAVTITSATAPAPFAAAGNCNGKKLSAGASCTFNVTFKPTAAGAAAATLTVAFSAPVASQTVSLSGTGVAPVASVSPGTLSFANQQVGTSSGAQVVTLTNNGTAPLQINNIAIGGANPGNFSQVNTCGNTTGPAFPATLAINGSCTINVTFRPNATGMRSGSVTITVAKPATSQTVSLSGTGVAQSASLAPASLSFGSQAVGTTSTAQVVTLSNTGIGPLTINSISLGGTNPGSFTETNTCGNILAVSGSCPISVTFKPTSAGAKSAVVQVRDGAGTQTASLTGTGTTGTGTPPVITSANNTTFTVGVSGSFTVTATGSPSPTITESGAPPTGVSFNSATGVLSGTPTQAGTFAITFTATNTAGTANQGFTLNVNKGTATVTLSNMTQAYTGAQLSPTVTTSPAGLSYSLSGAPDTNVATYPVTATVTDPNYTGTASGSFVINQVTPLFSGLTPSQTIAVGTVSISLSGTIAAGGTYPPSGEMVSITINSSTVQTSIGASGTFSTTFNTSSIPSSGTPYTIGYSYGGDANFASASDTSTTLRVVDGVFSTVGNLDIVNHTATLLNNGAVLIAGGYTTANRTPVAAQLYDPVAGNFTPANGDLNTPRSQQQATLLNNGTAVITGGIDSTGNPTSVVEVYDPVAGTFTVVTNAPTYFIANTSTVLNDGTVLLTGGSQGVYGNATNTAWIFNPSNNSFTQTATNMNYARWNHTATLLDNGQVLIAGGQDASFNPLATAEIYDPVSQTFTMTANPMNYARDFYTATLLNTGQVLLAGCDGATSNSAELYDPAAQTFTLTDNMNSGRCFDAATLLNNGKVLVTGGYDPSFTFNTSAELYDSAAGTFTPTGSLATGRYDFTMTRLDNGSALVVGGWTNGAPTIAEIYTSSNPTPPNLVSIAVPSQTIAAIGGTQRFIATGTFSDSSTHQLASVTWSAKDRAGTNVAQISNDASNPGVALAQSQGTATITACAGTICGSGTLTVGVLNYTQVTPATPPSPRCCVGMAFDAAMNSTLLFGGVQGYYSTLGDTWTFQGGQWSQLSPGTSPPPREGPGMAYDAATGTVVMFGGSSGLFGGACCDLSDTWIWNGANWTQANPSVSPPARRFDGDGMAYDPATQKVVLFGGNTQGNTTFLGDTWIWDGVAQTWTQMSPATSPSARVGHGMATDAAGNVVLFGGTDNASKTTLADTWVWNGTTWQQQFPVTSPPERSGHAMALDPELNEVILFAGYLLDDTWIWDGSNWTQVVPSTAPPDRYSFGMNYDSAAHGVLIFGGFSSGDIRPDTWELGLAP